MFIRIPKSRNLIRLPHNFFSLETIQDNGDLEIDVTYHINQSDVVRKNTATCRITAITRSVKKTNIVLDHPEEIDNKQVVKNILSLMSNTRNAIKNSESYIAAAKYADNTSKVNNENISLLRRGVPLSEISSMVKPRLALKSVSELNSENNIHPIAQINPTPPEPLYDAEPIRHILQTSLIRDGLDPTYVNEFNDDLLTPFEAFKGVYKKSSQSHIRNTTSKFSNFFRQITVPFESFSTISTIDVAEDKNILSYVYEVVDNVDITTRLILNNEKIRERNGEYKQLFLKFELLNNTGVAIEILNQRIDLLKHIEVFHTPKIPPIVKFAKFETQNKGNIQVKQQDKNAKAVQIFRKNFLYSINDIDSYTYVNEFPVENVSGFVTIPVDVSSRNTTIYRVIPVGENRAVSSEFTNVVINPSTTNKKITYCSITAKPIDLGIGIEIREIPAGVVALQVIRRDATIFETIFANVADDVIQVNPNDENAVYTLTDSNVKRNHLYEYKVKMIYRNGSETATSSETIEYIPQVTNAVSTQIQNVQVVYDANNLNVRFQVNTTVNNSNLDTIRTLLEKQGLDKFFINDLTAERSKFEKLIAHQIHRIDLTTGQRENFGEVTDTTFSDADLRTTNAVSPLKAGHRYRYEVTALLRATETLLEDFQKTAEDSETKKTYVYKPSKFLHPITLLHGNIATAQTLAVHYSKSPMSFGNIGNVVSTEVSFADDAVIIIDATVETFDKHNLLVKWRINGNPGSVDHFVIMKEFLGQRKIIGKTHACFEKNTFQFIYPMQAEDLGEGFFVILPIFNTYAVGTEIKTNGIQFQ